MQGFLLASLSFFSLLDVVPEPYCQQHPEQPDLRPPDPESQSPHAVTEEEADNDSSSVGEIETLLSVVAFTQTLPADFAVPVSRTQAEKLAPRAEDCEEVQDLRQKHGVPETPSHRAGCGQQTGCLQGEVTIC